MKLFQEIREVFQEFVSEPHAEPVNIWDHVVITISQMTAQFSKLR